MNITEKRIHKLLLGALFTVFNWLMFNNLIIDIPFWKYFLVELFLVLSMKFYKFTTRKLELQ